MTFRSPAGPPPWFGPWLVVFGTIAVVFALSLRALRPPAALDRSAPAERFSEGRAREVVRHLSENIGMRANGTAKHAQAAEYLAAELGKLPDVEVETQQVSDVHTHKLFPLVPFVYRTLNVLGRLPGKSSDAILLDAHFDTLCDSVGAADDAAGVAAILEVLRVLAAGPQLDRTILVNLNGAEEVGLLGAAAFTKHPWAKDVRAYVYLEALPGGKAVLIGAGPGHPWLAKTYARVAPAPLGNVMAQELTQSGLLPFNGDFTPFHEAGLVGLDVAMVGDAWAVHTRLDRLEHLEPGGLQHMGDATLAVTRALASQATSVLPTAERAVYYDLLGHTMLAYSMSVARGLGIVVLVAFALWLARALYLYWVTIQGVLAACAWNCLSVAAGVLAALAPAAVLKLVLHRSLGWFAHPALLIPSYALPAAAAMLYIHHRWRARALRKMVGDERRVELCTWMGGLLFWAFWLLLATVGGVGMGYVPLWWVAGGTAGLLLAGALPRLRLLGMLLALLPGAVVTVEIATLIVASIVPMAGLTPPEAPTDLVIAALVGLATCLVAVVAFTLPCRDGGLGRAAALCAGLGLAGLIATALVPPYTANRPKRLLAAHADDGEKSALLLAGYGPDALRPLLPSLPGASPAPASWPSLGLFLPSFSHMLPAGPPALSAPRAEVTASSYDSAADARQVALHLRSGGPQLRLLVPAAALLAWSVGEKLPARPPVDGKYLIQFEGVPESGVDVRLTLRGWQPVEIELRSIAGAPADASEVRDLAARLPDWVNLTAYSYRLARVKI
ncbi:MAG: M20/M25/M40 family metallo-hydrolase [Deltaproteobacteria bacterium]|nr:M20/M25/M40 family metallo-hydrolase [Deltaproteobacteria bacterium]